MQEEHLGLAANCSRTNMSDKQRQPINMNTNMAQMGSFNKSLSTKPNEVNPNSKGKVYIYSLTNSFNISLRPYSTFNDI